jgi:hypothetical protein
MQDDLNGVGANVSIIATIPLVIVSALNPALWAGQTHEGLRSYGWGTFGQVTGAETL